MSYYALTKERALSVAKDAANYCRRMGWALDATSFRRAVKEVNEAIRSENPILTALNIKWSELRDHLLGFSDINAAKVAVTPPSLEPVKIGEGVHANPTTAVVDGRESWNHLVDRYAKLRLKNELTSHRVVTMDHDHPIGIVFLGDMHIGSVATDYPRLTWLLSALRNPEIPLWVCSIGDILDSMIWPNVRFEQQKSGVDMEEEIAAAAWWLDEVVKAGRLLGICAGNHDLVSGKMTGNDHLNNVMQRLSVKDIPYHPYELNLTVELGGVSYEIRLRHKVQGNSGWNPAHGVAKAHRWDDGDADIIVAGHTHRSGAQEVKIKGKTRWGIQVGAYKRSELDDYAKENGFANENLHPDYTAILWPKTRKIEVLPTETALDLLERRAVSQTSSRSGTSEKSSKSGKTVKSTKSGSKAKKATKSSSRKGR